jgi:SAM-dependent methyltransferase
MKLYAKLLGIGEGKEKITWINQFIKGKSVLDLGCVDEQEDAFKKDNWLHKNIKEHAEVCVGIDSNEIAIEKLRLLGYHIYTGDVQNFDLKRKFDVIVAADILEHLDDFKGFFRCVHNALIENGLLIITTPNPWFFLRFVRAIIKGDPGCNLDHVAWFCQGTLRELLRRNGFTIETIDYGSSEKIFYNFEKFRKLLFHTSIFCAARKTAYLTSKEHPEL